jgi:hypothetical protein
MATQDSDRDTAGERIPMAEALRAVTTGLALMLDRPPAGVTSLKSTDEGWTAQVEVVEVPRIPDTASVMASYQVQLDARGEIVSYERVARYPRGRVDH